MTATPDISALAERLTRIAGEMERFLGPPEMAPGPDADDLTEAATALLALQSENTALRARLEEAEKVIRPFARASNKHPGIASLSDLTNMVLEIGAGPFRAAARWLEGK